MVLKMARLQISPTPKPVVNLWFSDNLEPVTESYDFQGTLYKTNYISILQGLFINHIQHFCQLKIKSLERDSVYSGPLIFNTAPIVCVDLDQLKVCLQNLKKDFYDLCVSKNIQFTIFLFRETIVEELSEELCHLIQTNVVNAGYDPKHFKIVYAGHDILTTLLPVRDYLGPVDVFSRILADIHTSKNIKKQQPSQPRTYKFSLLAGSLHGRYNRCLFFAKANYQNILTADFFYTMFLPKEQENRDVIRKMFHRTEYESIVDSVCDTIFKNKVYDGSGNMLVDKSIYDDQIEFDIPPQVLDSHIHIVLETSFNSPFITEKMYKPLMLGLPFIWHGQKDILQYLEAQGFKRYRGIDYRFDQHPNFDTRLDLLLQEIQRLNTIDLAALVEDNKDISEHNIEQFWEISKNFDDLWGQLK